MEQTHPLHFEQAQNGQSQTGVTKPDAAHVELVGELVEHLLAKYETLPFAKRRHVVYASIEAVAWIAASESAVYCQRHGQDIRDAQLRATACEKLFSTEIERDLTCSFDS